MRKQFIIIGIIAIFATIGLSGCTSLTEEKSTPEDIVIGDWISKTYYKGKYVDGSDIHYTFYRNGSCVLYTNDNGSRNWYSYAFTGQQLITTDSHGNQYLREYSFSSDKKELVLSSKDVPDIADFLQR